MVVHWIDSVLNVQFLFQAGQADTILGPHAPKERTADRLDRQARQLVTTDGVPLKYSSVGIVVLVQLLYLLMLHIT